MKQYRQKGTETWYDFGTGPSRLLNYDAWAGAVHRLGAENNDFETRDKPVEDLRQRAMDRVGELNVGERVNYSGEAPILSEDELKQAVRDMYLRERTTPFFDVLRLSVKEAEAVMQVRSDDAIRTDSFGDTPAERAKFPMFDGLLAYFPAALAWVARCSFEGNQQHNPGQPMHWAMDKSTDHENKILRHLMAGFTDDEDGVPHSVKVAWRSLARAQEDLMRRYGAPMPPNARRAHPERGNPVNQRDED